jgi:hypothetical protein
MSDHKRSYFDAQTYTKFSRELAYRVIRHTVLTDIQCVEDREVGWSDQNSDYQRDQCYDPVRACQGEPGDHYALSLIVQYFQVIPRKKLTATDQEGK